MFVFDLKDDEGFDLYCKFVKKVGLGKWTKKSAADFAKKRDEFRGMVKRFIKNCHVNLRSFARAAGMSYQTLVNFLTGFTRRLIDETWGKILDVMRIRVKAVLYLNRRLATNGG
jgi:hypothetical protein